MVVLNYQRVMDNVEINTLNNAGSMMDSQWTVESMMDIFGSYGLDSIIMMDKMKYLGT